MGDILKITKWMDDFAALQSTIFIGDGDWLAAIMPFEEN